MTRYIEELDDDGAHIRRVVISSYVIEADHEFPHFELIHSFEIDRDLSVEIRVIHCHYRRLEVRYPGAVPQRLYEFVYAGRGSLHSMS